MNALSCIVALLPAASQAFLPPAQPPPLITRVSPSRLRTKPLAATKTASSQLLTDRVDGHIGTFLKGQGVDASLSDVLGGFAAGMEIAADCVAPSTASGTSPPQEDPADLSRCVDDVLKTALTESFAAGRGGCVMSTLSGPRPLTPCPSTSDEEGMSVAFHPLTLVQPSQPGGASFPAFASFVTVWPSACMKAACKDESKLEGCGLALLQPSGDGTSRPSLRVFLAAKGLPGVHEFVSSSDVPTMQRTGGQPDVLSAVQAIPRCSRPCFDKNGEPVSIRLHEPESLGSVVAGYLAQKAQEEPSAALIDEAASSAAPTASSAAEIARQLLQANFGPEGSFTVPTNGDGFNGTGVFVSGNMTKEEDVYDTMTRELLANDWRPMYNAEIDSLVNRVLLPDESALKAVGAVPAIEEPPPVLFKGLVATKREEERLVNLFFNLVFLTIMAVTTAQSFLRVDESIYRGWTTSEILMRAPLDNLNVYMRMLHDDPVVTKGLTSGVVYAIGDWTAQMNEGRGLAGIDRLRLFRSASAGLLLHGPLSHVWYHLNDLFFEAVLQWESYWPTTLGKIVTDRAVFAPFWNACYVLYLGILELDPLPVIWRAIKASAIPLVIAGLKFWPFVSLVTYGLVPTDLRVLWVGFVSIFWVTIISSQAQSAQKSQREATVTTAEPPAEATSPSARIDTPSDAPAPSPPSESPASRDDSSPSATHGRVTAEACVSEAAQRSLKWRKRTLRRRGAMTAPRAVSNIRTERPPGQRE
ncbi:unnamed protein product [Vitrella brassicaformis CCMP3155]|uniref:Uncharacterized protein n=3 Tax=Vitrella brassicaformis TaxID=1169539 RepID=A0A0G4F6P0_VITBC|nr:unnamed protein product [Vitrella brassicaformis CCMP3155]|eukprot:CEM08092.1 unnamed protein product [Vitrella brassicaformis CCMP3155]